MCTRAVCPTMARFIPYTCLPAILLCIVFGAALCMAICAMVICMVWHITYLFCVGKVRPLYKKGDRSRPGNWRPICCAVTEAKLVLIVVFRRIPHRLYMAGVVPDNMWANVPGRSKQEASLLYDMYLDDEDPEALLASMDVKGAFPNTPHRLIVEAIGAPVRQLCRGISAHCEVHRRHWEGLYRGGDPR